MTVTVTWSSSSSLFCTPQLGRLAALAVAVLSGRRISGGGMGAGVALDITLIGTGSTPAQQHLAVLSRSGSSIDRYIPMTTLLFFFFFS